MIEGQIEFFPGFVIGFLDVGFVFRENYGLFVDEGFSDAVQLFSVDLLVAARRRYFVVKSFVACE